MDRLPNQRYPGPVQVGPIVYRDGHREIVKVIPEEEDPRPIYLMLVVDPKAKDGYRMPRQPELPELEE